VSRDESVYVADMLEACERVREYTSGFDHASFRSDRKTVDAVVRNLEVLGEAAKRVSPAVRDQAPSIPWREIAGMRDVLIHDYFGIDLDIVCDVVFAKVPGLESALRDLMSTITEPRA